MKTENHYTETDLGNISLNPRGEYDPEAFYEYLDTVSMDGGSYMCLADLGTKITGTPPVSGINTEHWQVLTLPGGLTPEYIAMHDDVVNKAKQVEISRAAVELSQNEIEVMQADITQLHTDTQDSAQSALASKNQAAGYASAADVSRQAAERAKQDVDAQIPNINAKLQAALNEIDTTRQSANTSVKKQEELSAQAVKDQTGTYITEQKNLAKQELDQKVNDFGLDVNAIKKQVADEGNKQVEAVRTTQTAAVQAVETTKNTAIQAVQTEGTTQTDNVYAEANKQIQNIIAAGGGIENALSNFFALRRTGKVYTTRIYKYDTSTSPTGVKLNDNEGLVRKPSTNTVIGQDDYREIGVFMHFPCNFTVDDKGFNHVTALQGQPDFKKTGKVDVGEVTMSAWVGITDNPEYVDYHYSDSPNETFGLRPMGESINPDGTISPFMIHGKYGAGDIDGVPYSSAGLILANGSQKGEKPVSHTGLIAYMGKKGQMYAGTTNWDLFYKQLMMIILYATTNSRSVMAGCNSYSMQEMAAVAETGVTRVILPKTKANNYIVGSYVSVGDIGSNTNKDRYYAYMHNLAYDVKILKIEPVDDTNSAIYLDTEPFNTTLTTCISTMPWRTGSTDSVLGSDGSPFSNTDNKNPFKIQGIETGYGAYEVLSNVFMDIVTDEDGTPKRDVYICMDASLLTTDMNAAKTRYKKVAAQVTYTAESWKYISKCFVDPALGIMVPTETKAGSTTGFCNGLYTDSNTSGQREWLSLGNLAHGTLYGLWILYAGSGVGTADWCIVSGVSPNGTRGEWQAAA